MIRKDKFSGIIKFMNRFIDKFTGFNMRSNYLYFHY